MTLVIDNDPNSKISDAATATAVAIGRHGGGGDIEGASMLSGRQLRAARALLGLDQAELANLADLSDATIQHMEASEGAVHGQIESLMKLLDAFDRTGIELIPDNAASPAGGEGVRLKNPPSSR